MSSEDQVIEAIKDFEMLFDLLDKNTHSEVGKSFRSRCREMPNIIADLGFVPALTFCYAKSDDLTYRDIAKAFETKSKISEDKGTKKGYALYLYLVLNRLSKMGVLDGNKTSDPLTALKNLAEGRTRIASKIILPYVLQLKKLSEAVFEAKEE